jgi:hypothetical protein
MTAKLWMARALSVAALVSGSVAAGDAAGAADPVKLTGCVVRAEDGDGYLLINVPREPAAASSVEPRTATPTVVGTTGVFANVFYWLDNDGDLRPHIGHQVEIDGELKGELKDGEIKIDRKDQWTEIEVESDGRDMKARVPNTSIVAAKDGDRKMAVLVRRVDVGKVRMLDATCR